MMKNDALNKIQEPFRTDGCAVHALSLRGRSHEMAGMPLQDSYAAAKLGNGWIVLAVADGVGSEPRSDKGASLAVHAVVRHLLRFWGFRIDEQSIELMLHAAYQAACADIYEQALKDQAPFRAYSTTLHTVIFSDGLLYIMHAGDGGVAILTENGTFQRLTRPMKAADGEAVIPLQAGPDAWQFSVCRERAQSVAVATDGVWDKLCPPVLDAYGDPEGIEKSIASYFLSPWARDWENMPFEEILKKETLLFRGDMSEAIPEFYNTLVSALAQGNKITEAQNLVMSRIAPGNIPLKLLQGIKDDITLLTLVRFHPLPKKTPLNQFEPTDWKAIQAWVNEKLLSASAKNIQSSETDTAVNAVNDQEHSPAKNTEDANSDSL